MRWAIVIRGLDKEGWTAQTNRMRWNDCACVGSGMNIFRPGGLIDTNSRTSGLSLLQQIEASGDHVVCRVKFCCASIRVDGVRNLFVAGLVETAKIEPDLGDVGIDAYGA